MSANEWTLNQPTGSSAEKIAARRAFDQAKDKWCAALHAEFKKSKERSSSLYVTRDIHDYLS